MKKVAQLTIILMLALFCGLLSAASADTGINPGSGELKLVLQDEEGDPIKGDAWIKILQGNETIESLHLPEGESTTSVNLPRGKYRASYGASNYFDPARQKVVTVVSSHKSLLNLRLRSFPFFFYGIEADVVWYDDETGETGIEISANVHNRLVYNLEEYLVFGRTFAIGSRYNERQGLMGTATGEWKNLSGDKVDFSFTIPAGDNDMCWDIYIEAGKFTADPGTANDDPVTNLTYGVKVCRSNGTTTIPPHEK